MSDEYDLGAQLELEGRLHGWQVYQAREPRWVAPVGDLTAKVEVPAGWCWAAHWHPDELPVVAETLAELEHLVGERTPPTEPSRPVFRDDNDFDTVEEIDEAVAAVADEHVERRLQELLADPPERSVMRELLGDDADRYEVAPGRWYLPGTPP